MGWWHCVKLWEPSPIVAKKDELKYKISELKNVCKKEVYFCSNITGEGIKKVLKKLENLYGKKKN